MSQRSMPPCGTVEPATLWKCAEASCPAACRLLCWLSCSYRILYNNVVCVAWLTYLSLLTHTKINILSFLHLTH